MGRPRKIRETQLGIDGAETEPADDDLPLPASGMHKGVATGDVTIAIRHQVLHYRPGDTIYAENDFRQAADEANAAIVWQD